MGKTKKTGDLVNTIITDSNKNITIPKLLTLGESPLNSDDSLKVPSTSWVNDKLLNNFVPYTGAVDDLDLGEHGLSGTYIKLNTDITTIPTSLGSLYWDSTYRTMSLIDGIGNTNLQLGQEQRVLVHNNTGSVISDGQVVYISGSTGELPSITLANAGSENTSAATLGVVTELIAHGGSGFVTISGIVNGLNTNSFNEGDLLWLGTTSGTFTNVKPSSPNHLVLIGYVIKKAGGNGSIFLKIQNTQELSESSDVLFTSLTNNDILTYESSSSLWKNKSISTILGYAPANDSNVVHKTGDETITGTKSFNSSTGIGIRSNNSGNGYGIYSDNSSTGVGYYVTNSGQGKGFLAANSLNSLGHLFEGTYNGTQNFVVNYLGELIASKLIKSGGTSSQFLKADGSVDSSTYLTSLSGSVLTTTDQTIRGVKTFLGNQTGSNLKLILADYFNNGVIESDNGFIRLLDGSTELLNVNKLGEITAAKFIKLGGTGTQYLMADGSVSTLTNPVTASTATANYLSKFTGSEYAISNSLIYDNGTNVGIGTTSPTSMIHAKASGYPTLTLEGGTNSGAGIRFFGDVQYAEIFGEYESPTNGQLFFRTRKADTISTAMTINSSGNVGIGTGANVNSRLHVDGQDIYLTGSTDNRIRFSNYGFTGNSMGAAIGYLYTTANTQEQGNLAFYTNPNYNSTGSLTERMRVTSGGNVLIGTSTDSGYKLDVEGYLAVKSGGYGGGGYIMKSYANGSSRNWGIYNDQLLFGDFMITTSSTQTGSPSTPRIYITPDGNSGIGTTTPAYKLDVAGTTISQAYIVNNTGNSQGLLLRKNGSDRYFIGTEAGVGGTNDFGVYNYIAGATSFLIYANNNYQFFGSNVSDIRAKENINDLDFNATEKIMSLQPKSYYMKNDESQIRYGLIAQEVNEILPDLICGDLEGEDYVGLDYNGVIPVLVKAIQELKAEIDLLKQN